MKDKPLQCYHCYTPVATEKLVVILAQDDTLRLEYTCPKCGAWTKFGYRDSYIYDAQRN